MIHGTPAWRRICDSLACPPGTIGITLTAMLDESIHVRCEHYADVDNGDLETMIAEYFIRAGHGTSQLSSSTDSARRLDVMTHGAHA